ncbi:MAG: bifunctional 4-hydroxy-2-oxoglutarate aldolase/2-dehydro-3-deoxy-phosphogluconate aldolase [Clostridiales bacterium]|nr:bifunctional 4-hydroxy-2-oxoglutarate aldolase/2-dehydro-3-deoxy-phosphogluconate aldolase [Clostridiales bacterium]
MNEILKEISKIGIVPVVKLDNSKDALPLAKALINGGLPCAEVTFRTDAAEDAIRQITGEYPEMLVGAGTVLTTEQVDRAVAAGAKFIVTPGFNAKIVKYCIEKNIPITPGCPSSSDIEAALELGLDVVKFFPAENLGGIKMIKALAAPYVGVKFMPTGGINADNINSYLDCDKILACGGSWMVKDTLINQGRFDEIERLTREAVTKMLGFRLGHVAINNGNEQQAKAVADMFTRAFGFSQNDIAVSIFCTGEIEVMKNSDMGTMGHIAIKTNYMDKAIAYLERQGIELDYDTAKYDDKGNVRLIYLKQEFGGFAVHLCP